MLRIRDILVPLITGPDPDPAIFVIDLQDQDATLKPSLLK